MGREGFEPPSHRVKAESLPVELPTRKERQAGIEPATSALARRRSGPSELLTREMVEAAATATAPRCGTGIEPATPRITTSESRQRLPPHSSERWTRTIDLAGNSRLLYLLSYPGTKNMDPVGLEPTASCVQNRCSSG